MCRILLVRSRHPVPVAPVLSSFARACRASREYQGDGWGVHLRRENSCPLYRSVAPIWEDDLGGFGRATFILAHARSAFRNASPSLGHTMPFVEGDTCFAFNGELRGVRVRAEGSNGALKIFSFIRRLLHSDPEGGFQRAVMAIRARTKRLRALNILMINGERVLLSSVFSNEEENYFNLHVCRADGFLAICSVPLADVAGWRPLPNNIVEVLE